MAISKRTPERKRKGLLWKLAQAKEFRQLWPESIKRFGRLFLGKSYLQMVCEAENPFLDCETVSTYPASVDVTLGIIREFLHTHKYYIGACRTMGVPYKLVDISGPDWQDVIANCQCDAFLVRPSARSPVWKQMCDERIRIMVEDMGSVVYPSPKGMWVYESKRRMHYWLKAHNVPHAKTWVFYDEQEAIAFAQNASLPIIFKLDMGAGGAGVYFLRSRRAMRRMIRRAFGRGIRSPRGTHGELGVVLFQEILPVKHEWRILRLGDSYFGHQKLRKGNYHSGSSLVGWETPPPKLLDFAREVTRKGNFTSMDLDIFETEGGQYLVNELQALFGSYKESQMYVDGKPGRFVHRSETGKWEFEEGIFCRNGSCELRVEALLKILGKKVPKWRPEEHVQ